MEAGPKRDICGPSDRDPGQYFHPHKGLPDGSAISQAAIRMSGNGLFLVGEYLQANVQA